MSYIVKIEMESFSFTGNVNNRQYTVPYHVISSVGSDSDVLSARKQLPNYGTTLSQDSGVFLRDVNLNGLDFAGNDTVFRFNAVYSTPTPGSNNNQTGNDPLTAPPLVSTGTAKYNVPFELAYKDGDEKGNPTREVVTTAKNKFDPPATTIKPNSILNVIYNSAKWDGAWKTDFEGTINKSALSIVGQPVFLRTVRINELNAQNNWTDEGLLYWTITIQFEIADVEYRKRLRNADFEAFSGGKKYPIYIFEREGGSKAKGTITTSDNVTEQDKVDGIAVRISDPVPLDEDGAILATSEDTIYLPFQEHFPEDWKVLNIPSDRISSKYSSSLGGIGI